MEVAGVVFRQSPCFSSAAADVSSSRHSRLCTTVRKPNSVGVKQRKWLGVCVVAGEYSDKGHLKYYEGTRMAVKEKEKDEMVLKKKDMKKKLKLLKGLSKNLNTFSEMGFCLDQDDGDGLGQQVKGKMISEATEVLLGQLQKLKQDKMEYKRMKKEEKAKKKMMTKTKTDCKDSSSSSSESSSESDCDNVVNMRQLKTVPTSTTNTHQETTSAVQVLEKAENLVAETAVCKIGSSVNEADCGKKIEVCMGGKCKKSGAAMLLENFQAAVGGEATVVGCKCMGKCRDGPNVKVHSEDVAPAVTNSLCIGVGLEDVETIVTNFFGGGSDMVPALS
ncbi:putative diacylglycerol O-acyltransferase [Helianthus debilis subsp. tardiflorus]